MIRQKRCLILFFAIFFLGTTVYSQAYKYPIQPGTESWKKLITHDEMLQVTQIPENILKQISTSDLLSTCFEYPLLMDVLAFNNLKTGYQTVLGKFNGFQELKLREDNGINFINAYGKIDIIESIDKSMTLAQRGTFAIKVSIYELMLTDVSILDKLNPDQLRYLINEVQKKLRDKEINREIFGSLGKLTSVYLLSKLLEKEGKIISDDSDIIQFNSTMLLRDVKILDRIIEIANQTIK